MKVPGYLVCLDIDKLMLELRNVLRRGWLTTGPVVEDLEAAWRQISNLPFAVGVSSGERALDLALEALLPNRAMGRFVVVPGIAFVGDASAVIRAGRLPLFLDVDGTMQLSYEELRHLAEGPLASRVDGVIVVHIGGYISWHMNEIRALCTRMGWFLIEDACHAHGAAKDGAPPGTWGDATALSFYATKVVPGGEGGMLLTPHERVYEYARLGRMAGCPSPYDLTPKIVASDCRLSDLLAVIALYHTQKLRELHVERAQYAKIYDRALDDHPGIWPLVIPDCEPSWYKYVVMTTNAEVKAAWEAKFKEAEIGLGGAVYGVPTYEHDLFGRYLCVRGQFAPSPLEMSDRLAKTHLCLPMYNGLGRERAEYVASILAEGL